MAESSGPQKAPPEADAAHQPRRNFFYEIAAVIAGGIVAVVPLAAGLFSFLDPVGRKSKLPEKFRDAKPGGNEGFIRVCSLDALEENGAPQRFPVISNEVNGWNFTPQQAIGSVYVQRVGEKEVRVFNTTCPHAGCSVSSDGAAYYCPCHNSSFSLDGEKLASDSGRENPSPRAMDSLDVDQQKLAVGDVWVEFKNFYIGREEKVAKS